MMLYLNTFHIIRQLIKTNLPAARNRQFRQHLLEGPVIREHSEVSISSLFILKILCEISHTLGPTLPSSPLSP